jgi:quinol monooxygenase YgiN
MIVVHASFPIDPAQRDEALELAEMLVDVSNEEPGVVEYRAAIDLEDENVLRFIERYEDGAAFESHTETDHFQRFEERLPDLLHGEPEVMRFEVTDAAEVEL